MGEPTVKNPTDSILARAEQRREQLVQEAASTLIRVPGWTDDVPCYLRVHPLPHSSIRAATAQITRAKEGQRAEADLSANTRIIVDALEGVVIGDEEERVELDLFDPRTLAVAGAREAKKPRDILLGLCLGKHGSLIKLSEKIQRHSGYEQEEADRAFLGE